MGIKFFSFPPIPHRNKHGDGWVLVVAARAQSKAREAIVVHHMEGLGDIPAQGISPKFSRTPGSIRWAGAWKVGAHNEEVYGGLLGIAEIELAALKEARII
jgi:crotonobetainyl-CoA:carnitine CoA-transferase CaiB-like acyl-CoA transferase